MELGGGDHPPHPSSATADGPQKPLAGPTGPRPGTLRSVQLFEVSKLIFFLKRTLHDGPEPPRGSREPDCGGP
jgi:hypothetical protein